MERKRITQENFHESPLLARLTELFDIPDFIFVEGSLPECKVDAMGILTPRILTIVGSRDHSPYAESVIEHLVSSLAGENVVIVSGLALGVDSLAHKAALKHGIPTIAIPGSGLSPTVLYPREHVSLAEKIVSHGGALISELGEEERAMKWTFLSRNRLMAVLSDAVLIIEAKEKSGTLVTARQALELGKTIGVVPGNIFSDYLRGSHALLSDGATPVTSQADLYNLLSLTKKEETGGEQKTLPLLSPQEKLIFDLLREPTSKADLLEKSGLPAASFLAALSTLELHGLILISLQTVRKL